MVRFFRRKQEGAAAPAETVEEAPEAPEQPAAAEPSEAVEAPKDVEHAVERTRRTWFSRIGGMFRRGLDDELWDELEETLIAADTGVETTVKVLENLKERVKVEGIRDPEQAEEALKEELLSILEVDSHPGTLWGPAAGSSFDRLRTTLRQPAEDGGQSVPKPAVILVIGVNGTGKTTSIAKLAHAYKEAGKKVIMAAGDTFRAAAIDQLKQWGQRVGVDVVAHQQGADPGAVVFDTLSAAQSRDADVVIIDTAGRLHTKVNLMEELRKVNRVIQRKFPDAPHEVLLVLDATSGQNALPQAKYFTEAVGVTGVLLAKLDGTAKGGVIFAVCDQMRIPVRFVGTGERADDLAYFEPRRFVDALFA
jgi:fused signal recognition particle receptor